MRYNYMETFDYILSLLWRLVMLLFLLFALCGICGIFYVCIHGIFFE